MELSVKTNAKEVSQRIKSVIDELPENIEAILQDWGNSVVRSAKKSKPYKRRTGNLDRSQKAYATSEQVLITIDPRLVTHKGFNYGSHLHETKYAWLEREVENRFAELERKIVDEYLGVFE